MPWAFFVYWQCWRFPVWHAPPVPFPIWAPLARALPSAKTLPSARTLPFSVCHAPESGSPVGWWARWKADTPVPVRVAQPRSPPHTGAESCVIRNGPLRPGGGREPWPCSTGFHPFFFRCIMDAMKALPGCCEARGHVAKNGSTVAKSLQRGNVTVSHVANRVKMQYSMALSALPQRMSGCFVIYRENKGKV